MQGPSRLPLKWREHELPAGCPSSGENMIKYVLRGSSNTMQIPLGCLFSGDYKPYVHIWSPSSEENVIEYPLRCFFNGENSMQCHFGCYRVSTAPMWHVYHLFTPYSSHATSALLILPMLT